MANILSKSSGNLTAVGSWCNPAAGSGASQTTVSSNTNCTASYVWSTAFTVTTSQTLTGVWIYCCKVSTASGTFSVALSDDNGVTATREVTVNAADLPPLTTPAWTFFKFGSTLASDGGTDYKVGVKCSFNPNSTVYRDGTAGNWAHMIGVSANAGALAAGDVFYISGELTGAGTGNDITITMDNTDTTDWGAVNIGIRGIMTYGTSASTNYYFKCSGLFTVTGTLNIGTTGTPMPRNSSAVLEFDPTTDGEFGLTITDGGVFNAQGLSRTSGKNIYACQLNADAASSATTLNVDTDTGWLNGDIIGIAPTQRVTTQFEQRTLNAGAGASSMTISSGLTNAHDGTGNLKADIILLSRNVKIRSSSSTLMSYVNFKALSTVDVDWVEFYYLGENAGNKRGIEIATTTGSCSIQYSSLHDCEDYGVYNSSSSGGNFTFSYNVMYNLNSAGTASISCFYLTATSGTNNIITYNILIGNTGTSCIGFNILDIGGTFTNNTACGCIGAGIYITEAASLTGTFSYLKGYCCSVGVSIYNFRDSGITNISTLRNTADGFDFNYIKNCAFNNLTSIGNTTANLNATGPTAAAGANFLLYFDSLITKGESSYSTGSGFKISNDLTAIYITNSRFGETTAHTSGDFYFAVTNVYTEIYLSNTILASSTEFSSPDSMVGNNGDCFITSAKHDGTTATHKTTYRYGIISYTTSVPSGWTSPCMSIKAPAVSGSVPSAPIGMGMKCAVDSGSTVTVSVKIQKDVNYNGSQPRLIVRKNVAAGISADTVLATATVGTATNETLSGTTATVSDDAVLEFIVDRDGTAGYLYVDDWAVS